uniref:Uncharacterized protein n=1 Tax=virus sp. ctML55 TaxID=2827627 RepID=A0A8S5RI27_9VIRU|nr:MAG TPA: hypothetical protein [virus sp. ctML55]
MFMELTQLLRRFGVLMGTLLLVFQTLEFKNF